jgi:signal transduction histidine kinase
MRYAGMSLGLAALTGVAILAGGLALGRRTVQERMPAAREALRQAAFEANAELARLESQYERNLRNLAVGLPGKSTFDAIKSCQTVVGVRQYSELPERSGDSARHVRTDGFLGEALPQPALASAADRAPSPQALRIPREKVFGAAGRRAFPTEGWVIPRGSPWAVFWVCVDGRTCVALLVDRSEVEGATVRSLEAVWPGMARPLASAGVAYRLEGPGGVVLAAGEPPPPVRPPDVTTPLAFRVGEFQLLAWDAIREQRIYHAPTLILASALACGVWLSGFVLYGQQRRAQRLAEQRVSFVNRVSHELGTPLTNILLNLDLAADHLEARPAEARKRLDLVREEAGRLGRLVANVLTFSRRERGKLALRPAACVPDEVIGRVWAQFEPALSRRGVKAEVRLGASVPVLVDADALAQVASNLISNVEKYAAQGGWLGLETGWRAGVLTLRVADRGPGIPAGARARIFEPFERVRNAVSDGAAGTGLGLTIARDLAALMGGSLCLADSEIGALFELRASAPAAPVREDRPC